MDKYVKVMFGIKSGATSDLEYKVNEVNVANNWNINAKSSKEFGGFNYAFEDSILRWLHRGNTIYDIKIPKDAEVIKLERATTIYRTNKIIISNPRKVDDDLALHCYEISKISEKAYFQSIAVVSIMGYKKTAMRIIRDKVNTENIDEVLEEWNNFIFLDEKANKECINGVVKEIDEILNEIKSDLLICINADKEPYIRDITNDNVINITGESGSGKSYYTNKYINNDNYIVVDTDLIFSNQETQNKHILELRKLFKDKENNVLITDFDNCYLEILKYFKDSNKTIVIDSAQYRNIKDYSILKGKIIIMRTCVDTCYDRCINRWKSQKSNYTDDELNKYSNRKLGMYNWYKVLNKFIEKIDKL